MAVRRFPIRGEIDLVTVHDLQTKLDVLISGTDDDLVLDCEDLEFIDGMGVAVIVQAHEALEAQGRECRIVNMSDRARLPFDGLGLTERLDFSELDPA
jgi:anti-sigma B factor antagonist